VHEHNKIKKHLVEEHRTRTGYDETKISYNENDPDVGLYEIVPGQKGGD